MNYNDFYLLRHANGEMPMNMMIASSVKIINKYNFLPYTNSNQPGWFHVETYICVLRL